MKVKLQPTLLFVVLNIVCIFLVKNVCCQSTATAKTIIFPLPYEELSLYDFAEMRFETKKTELPPGDLVKKNFQPLKEIYKNDSLYFVDSIQSVWLKFSVLNTYQSDTSVALVFPATVNKAILYKSENDRLTIVGKTGFSIAVIKRSISYHHARIDILLKTNAKTEYFIQISSYNGIWMPKMPVLENVPYAEMKAFSMEKEFNRLHFLWAHFFTGIFFMFFLFGIIKYLVLGRDIAYLYYALFGLFNAFLTVAQAEYPPLEFPWFENLRGIELFNLINGFAILMQGLFIIEVLEIKIKYPRITHVASWFLFLQLGIAILYTVVWIAIRQYHYLFWNLNTFIQFLLVLFMLSWVWYLATIKKKFYRFILLGALTIFIASALAFLVRFFNAYDLLPAWLGPDQRGNVNHFIQIALLIDMLFYFTGLAYRDRQVQKEKFIFQEQLINQLKENKKWQEKFTNELEQQVKEKTARLIQQSTALEAEKEAKLLADFNRKISESELKAMRSQMNPHFVFNILNTIESYALENNKEAASEMIQKFSRLTRLVLENSINQLVPFENDWKTLRLYIELEQMRYADRFLVNYTIEKELLKQDYYIPPMIIQPFVENAIIHGLRNKEGNRGILNLSASLDNGYIVVQVEDNGVGRKKAALLKANNPIHKNSLGIRVTQDRISIFNNLNPHKKAKVDIQDLQKGTLVVIMLPVIDYPHFG